MYTRIKHHEDIYCVIIETQEWTNQLYFIIRNKNDYYILIKLLETKIIIIKDKYKTIRVVYSVINTASAIILDDPSF